MNKKKCLENHERIWNTIFIHTLMHVFKLSGKRNPEIPKIASTYMRMLRLGDIISDFTTYTIKLLGQHTNGSIVSSSKTNTFLENQHFADKY